MEEKNEKQGVSPEAIAEKQAVQSAAAPTVEKKESVSKEAEQALAADAKDVEKNKAITFLSYLGLLFLVPLLAARESKFAQFHAKQGLVLVIGEFLGTLLMPFFMIGTLVWLAIAVLSVMGLINVSQGKMEKLPLVGDLAEKFNI